MVYEIVRAMFNIIEISSFSEGFTQSEAFTKKRNPPKKALTAHYLLRYCFNPMH